MFILPLNHSQFFHTTLHMIGSYQCVLNEYDNAEFCHIHLFTYFQSIYRAGQSLFLLFHLFKVFNGFQGEHKKEALSQVKRAICFSQLHCLAIFFPSFLQPQWTKETEGGPLTGLDSIYRYQTISREFSLSLLWISLSHHSSWQE